MAAPKKTPASTPDVNELLAFTPADETPEFETDSVRVAPSFEDVAANTDAAEEEELDAEIEALKAALAQPELSEPELSPKQIEIARLREQMAEREARERMAAAQPAYDVVDAGTEVITIHVVEDGFTCQGEVFYRGQEIVFPIGGRAIEQTKDRNGKSWLDMRNDDDAQYERYGKVYFREGNWPYKPWEKLRLADLPADAKPADLERAIQAERKRRRLAPIV